MKIRKQTELLDLSKLSPDEKIDYIAEVANKRADNFEDNDIQIKVAIDSLYTDFSGHFEEASADQQIMILSKLHYIQEFSAWLIGEFLMRIKNQIEDPDDPRKSDYSSINDWFIKNIEYIPFSQRQMYNYISIREKAELENFLELGVRKTIEVIKIKDAALRAEAIKRISENTLTAIEAKELVSELQSREYEAKLSEKEKLRLKKKKERQKVNFDITMRSNKIVITAADKHAAECINNAILELEPAIKDRVLKQLENDLL